MNTETNNEIYYVDFNQDCTSLAIGTKSGYRLFSLHSVDSLDPIYNTNEFDEIHIVERLFSSSLVAIVGLSSPRKLRICHFKKGTEICNYSYSNSILSVKLNRMRLVVCLEDSLHIHNIRDMKVLHTIRDTPPNTAGLCSLSTNSDNCYLAYPGSSTIGEVQIFDAINLHSKTMIAAHDSPLAALAFSHQGTRIATASEKGTVIRVFNVNDGSKLFEFRRGMKRCVTIRSMAFSMDGNYLCCSSNTETVHVFRLEEPKDLKQKPPIEDSQTWMGLFTKAVSASANYLPAQVTDVFNQGRAFVSVHLPYSGMKNVCAVVVIQKVLRLLVASSDGYLYVYNLDMAEGGECPMWKQHKIHTGDMREGFTDEYYKQIRCAECRAPRFKTKYKSYKLDGTDGKPEKKSKNAQKLDKKPELPDPDRIGSYAGVLKGHSRNSLSDSDKYHEMSAAVAEPPKDGLRLDDDSEFPPVPSSV
ncbi:WD repeat domain phosphoinositide-interacting protein 2 isoform X2 [Planococcus citri]|uniref:WD repeat domain phosphoinositide-interacting protein 2 isoform X2 n=1 Tax=Planococcus citri TaxID=170843 RepID=UPI0031F8FE58